MSYDSITEVTDNLHDNLASYQNEKKTAIDHLMSASAYASYVRTQSMTANVTLTDSDFPIQSFSPTAARDLTLPAVASTNHPYFVINRSATYEITVKNAGATVIGVVAQNSSLMVFSDGANGWYVPGDNRSMWEEVASTPATPSTGKWRIYFKSDGLYVVDDAGVATGPFGTGGASGMPSKYLYGLTVSNNATDATNDIDVKAGGVRDTTNTDDMVLAAALTGKQLDAAWAVGSSAGFLDQGTIANATYHIHLIKRSDTGVVDAIASLSHDESATVTMTIASPAVVTWGVTGNGHGLVAGSPFKFSTTGALPTGVTAGTQYYVIATGLAETTFQFSTTNGGSAVNTSGTQSGVHTGLAGPKLPTSYTYFRRIFSFVRTGAAIKPFIHDGDDVSWVTPVNDLSASNPGTSAVTRTLTLPTGIRVNAHISVLGVGNAFTDLPGAIYMSDLQMTNSTPSATMFSFKVYVGAGSNDQLGGPVRVFTNRSAQVRSRLEASTAGTTLYIVTHGWTDTRGK